MFVSLVITDVALSNHASILYQVGFSAVGIALGLQPKLWVQILAMPMLDRCLTLCSYC